jgi:hypothetical protein
MESVVNVSLVSLPPSHLLFVGALGGPCHTTPNRIKHRIKMAGRRCNCFRAIAKLLARNGPASQEMSLEKKEF